MLKTHFSISNVYFLFHVGIQQEDVGEEIKEAPKGEGEGQ